MDRLHTVLHDFLIVVCDAAGIAHGESETTVALLRKVENGHPRFADLGPRAQDIKKVLNASASILDALLPVRNQASVAHPNELLLDEPEARLVINVGGLSSTTSTSSWEPPAQAGDSAVSRV